MYSLFRPVVGMEHGEELLTLIDVGGFCLVDPIDRCFLRLDLETREVAFTRRPKLAWLKTDMSAAPTEDLDG